MKDPIEHADEAGRYNYTVREGEVKKIPSAWSDAKSLDTSVVKIVKENGDLYVKGVKPGKAIITLYGGKYLLISQVGQNEPVIVKAADEDDRPTREPDVSDTTAQ